MYIRPAKVAIGLFGHEGLEQSCKGRKGFELDEERVEPGGCEINGCSRMLLEKVQDI